MKRVIIYGVGNNYKAFSKNAVAVDFEVVALADRYKAGNSRDGRTIISPEEIKGLEYDEVFVTNCWEREKIIAWLQEEIGVPKDVIRDVRYLNERYMIPGIEQYKYVFFADYADYINYPYDSLREREDVTIRSVLMMGEEWECDFEQDSESYFIFHTFPFKRFYQERFFEYIRKRFPQGKEILCVSDVCEGGEHSYSQKMKGFFSIEYVKKQFDMVITYHVAEAEKFGFEYHPYPYRKTDLPETAVDTDVFYVGNAKDRLDLIHSVFLKLKKAGVKCDFRVNRVDEEDQLKGYEGITYNHRLTYRECMELMMGCKCILDICQQNDESALRFAEAVVYNKRLLVNEPSRRTSPYYNDRYIQFFTDADSIDTDWLKEQPEVDYGYQGDFSVESMLSQIDEFFQIKAAESGEEDG